MDKLKIEAYIFGGTFDPIHQGHVGVIREILDRKRLIVIAPTEKNPWKEQSAAEFSARLEMIRLVLDAENFEFSTTISQNGIYLCRHPYVYVCDFVSWWRNQASGSIHWVVGEDVAEQVNKWRDWDKLNIGLYVARTYADDLHSTDIRNEVREFHPAIRTFVQERNLYSKSS